MDLEGHGRGRGRGGGRGRSMPGRFEAKFNRRFVATKVKDSPNSDQL